MTAEEKQQIATMSARIMAVVDVIKGNDAANFTDADLDDLANVLANIAAVMLELTTESSVG